MTESNQLWLKDAHHQREQDAQRFFNALKNEEKLFNSLQKWQSLSFEQRMALLPLVFKVECQILDMVCPELVINNSLYPTRAVNFVFDVRFPGSGLVFLNPDKLKDMAVYAPLAFLIHETRHAYQFQLGFSQQSLLAKGYKAAFTAQAGLSGYSFSDFLTLLNEYEAFQFANHVIGLLIDWRIDMPNMGTFASQFDDKGQLKINLVDLAEANGNKSLLDAYNQQAKAHYYLRNAK
ncbi:hypothetical protein [Thalassomonas sp. RHCl1]|uniref:hypothetical protein n=1 Tax=Thalassomonas sp. RHCl1 TaxID=2995320 RepID=UPI00248C5018|nr:hypothetical protein [Thalassomonas sp. RHCl1]